MSLPATQGRAPVKLDSQLIEGFVNKHAAYEHGKACDALGIAREKTYVIAADGEVPQELLALLAYVAAGSLQRNKWRAKSEGGRDGARRVLMERAKPRELWAFRGVCKLLVSLVDIRKNQYALDDEDDEDDGGGGGGGRGRGGGGGGGGGGGRGSSQAGLTGVAAACALRAAERRNLEAVLQKGMKRMMRLRDEGKRARTN